MTQTCKHSMARISLRLPRTVRETIDRAAAIQGCTRTHFLIAAAQEKAEQVITEQTILRLTMRDQELLARALQEEKIVQPTPFLKNLAEEYATRVERR